MGPKPRIPVYDSIRGILLVWMTLDHMGGPIAAFMFERLGFFSAAEGFFFLSGFIATRVALQRGSASAWFRARAAKVWGWHLASLVMVAGLALWLAGHGWKALPGLSGAGGLPGRDILGAVTLVHLPDYLDVLPLYVVLLLLASLTVSMGQRSPLALLVGSFLVWIAAQLGLWVVVRSVLPAWMHAGAFDPLAWQLVFMSGSALAMHRQGVKPVDVATRSRNQAWLAGAACLFFLAWKSGWLGWPAPDDMSFLASRGELGPLRIASFASILWAASLVVRLRPSLLTFRPLAMLGRHSLQVYSIHLPLVYLWLFRPSQGYLAVSFLVPLAVLSTLFAFAFLQEAVKNRSFPRILFPTRSP